MLSIGDAVPVRVLRRVRAPTHVLVVLRRGLEVTDHLEGPSQPWRRPKQAPSLSTSPASLFPRLLDPKFNAARLERTATGPPELLISAGREAPAARPEDGAYQTALALHRQGTCRNTAAPGACLASQGPARRRRVWEVRG